MQERDLWNRRGSLASCHPSLLQNQHCHFLQKDLVTIAATIPCMQFRETKSQLAIPSTKLTCRCEHYCNQKAEKTEQKRVSFHSLFTTAHGIYYMGGHDMNNPGV